MGTRRKVGRGGARRIWGVLIADIVASKRVAGLKGKRDRLLEVAGKRQREDGVLRAGYAVTAYDEFQGLVARPEMLPRAVWELRRDFYPLALRIGLGLGEIRGEPRADEPINITSTGEAFFRARESLQVLTEGKEKYLVATRLRSGGEGLDLAVNLAYGLLDSLLRTTTARQWQTIRSYEQSGRLEMVARDLEIDESTVSRNLRRGSYWQALSTVSTLTRLFERHVSVQIDEFAPERAT